MSQTSLAVSGVQIFTPYSRSSRVHEVNLSISLPALSKICKALECKPGDLLEYITDAEDAAIAYLIKSKTAARKSKKGSAK
ncbi:MAG: helix-turn-helix transcriptional regulator [Chloracidobacterium sp.]|nr:helix-turn-helix transcriptional regulator [Chloracidobacterium sp.]